MPERTRSNASVSLNGGHRDRKRPGPFGPAWALLPKKQQPLVLDGTTPASDPIERMVDNGLSQIPVADRSGRIIGVFTWHSVSKRAKGQRAENAYHEA